MKNRILVAAAVAAAVGQVGLSSAQNVSTVWQINNPQSWLTISGSGARGMTFNPVTGNVLVAGIDGGNNIQVINGASGSVGTPMTVTGITGGGGAALQKVRVVNRGSGNYSVYACNLITNARTDAAGFKIYRWSGNAASESGLGAPTVIYANNSSDGTAPGGAVGVALPAWGVANNVRIGDGMDIKSNGTTTEFFIGASQGGGATAMRLLKFTYNEGDATISAAPVEITVTGTALGTGNNRGQAVDSTGNKLYYASNTTLCQMNFDGTGSTEVYSSNSPISGPLQANSQQPRIGTISGRKYLGAVEALNLGSTAGAYRRAALIDITNGIDKTNYYFTFPLGVNPNANGTGDVSYDETNNRVYVLVTNNYVGCYTLPTIGTGTTKIWDGGAATANWTDAANWNGDTLPTINDDVVLDHTSVTLAYNVDIPQTSGTQAVCRTLKVGDGGNPISLTVPATNTQAMALLVAGDGTTAHDVEIRNGGTIVNNSGAGNGYVLYNLNDGCTNVVRNGGTQTHNTARSYSGVFQTAGPGTITYEDGSTVILGQSAGTAVSQNGRSYGNLTLTATSARTYTASGGINAAVRGTLTLGTNVTFNPTMTGRYDIGNIVNSGSGGTFSGQPLVLGSSTTIGTASPSILLGTSANVIVSGTSTLTYNPATVAAGQVIQAESAATVAFANPVTISGSLLVRNGATISGSAVTWGSTAFIGTDLATGFPTSALPGFTNSGAYPYPSTQGYRFMGPAAQVAGPELAGGAVEGLRADTTVTLPAASGFLVRTTLNVNLPLLGSSQSIGSLVSDTPGTTLTLGTSTAATGSFSFNTGRIDNSFVFRRWIASGTASRDFPLAANGVSRWIPLGYTATAGGTVAASFVATPTAESINITSSPLNITKVANEGFYRVILGDGFTQTANTASVSFEYTGFAGTSDQTQLTVLRRPVGGGAWTSDGAVPTPGTGRIVRTAISDLQGEYGLGGTITAVPVSLSGLSIE